jgi:hypothetical protein
MLNSYVTGRLNNIYFIKKSRALNLGNASTRPRVSDEEVLDERLHLLGYDAVTFYRRIQLSFSGSSGKYTDV